MDLFHVRLFGKTFINNVLAYSDSYVVAEDEEDAVIKVFNFVTEKYSDVYWERDTAFIEVQ
jgi:hypothetical protein